MKEHALEKLKLFRASVFLTMNVGLFLTFGEQGLLAVKNRDLDEIRKKVGRRSEQRREHQSRNAMYCHRVLKTDAHSARNVRAYRRISDDLIGVLDIPRA